MLTKTVKSFGLAMGLLACSLPLYAKTMLLSLLLAVQSLVLVQAQQIVQLTQQQKFQLMLINAVPQIKDLANVSGIQALQIF